MCVFFLKRSNNTEIKSERFSITITTRWGNHYYIVGYLFTLIISTCKYQQITFLQQKWYDIIHGASIVHCLIAWTLNNSTSIQIPAPQLN